jgi:hypothetical protein
MLGISRLIRRVFRRQRAASPVERLRLQDDSPVMIQPWEPVEVQPEPDTSPTFRVISTEQRREAPKGKPRGLADDDWRSRTGT